MRWSLRPIPKQFAELEVGAKFWDYFPDGDEFTKHGDEPTSARPFKPQDVVDVLVPIHVWALANLCRWFFGHWRKELWLFPHRRWLVALAFSLRWREYNRLGDFAWRLARLGSFKNTQPALAACATRMLMGGIMEGRE